MRSNFLSALEKAETDFKFKYDLYPMPVLTKSIESLERYDTDEQ